MDLKMLIERVKADDADALNTIYEAYVPMMRNDASASRKLTRTR